MGSEAVSSSVMTLDTINPNIREVEFKITGHMFTRYIELESELRAGVKKPFDKLLKASMGDCHLAGMNPITFVRQVLAVCAYPELLKNEELPEDVKARARRMLHACRSGSIGSYTQPWGLTEVRQDVAAYIAKRDGHPSHVDDIVICSGASSGIRDVMKMLLTGKAGVERAGFMIPIPQYPLYSASITEFGGYSIMYYLDESKNWSLDIPELERAIAEAKSKCIPRALVVVNPGNPSGSILTRENMEKIIKFAYQNKLFLMADEVYQQNVWTDDVEYLSFKKVLMEMGGPYKKMELASFMSISKGYMGECGMRGGFVEVINLQQDVKAEYMKAISTLLCPPVSGQVVLDCIVNPPKPGDPSYDTFIREKADILDKLKEKARVISQLFNSIEGISCVEVMGSMYAFPRIHMPEKAIRAAKEAGVTPGLLYSMTLLEETGICTMPGCSFGEMPGTYHIRFTILPPIQEYKAALERFKKFHLEFLEKYT